jgi:hypothetical protein
LSAEKNQPRRVFDFYPLEDRILLSADGVDGADSGFNGDVEYLDAVMEQMLESEQTATEARSSGQETGDETTLLSAEGETTAIDAALVAPEFDPTRPLEVVIVDAGVEDSEILIDGLRDQDDEATQWWVIRLTADEDGVSQIGRALEQVSGVDAVHLISHGDGGGVRLGNSQLDSGSIAGYAGEIASWSDCFDEDADLLIYGCDLASTGEGRELLESLSALSGCDVAASDDATGHEDLGGDWELEYATGVIETSVAFQEVLGSWYHVLEDTGFKSASATGEDYSQWTDANQAYASDDVNATEDRNGEQQDWYNFAFGVPSGASIDGIEVQIEGQDLDFTGNGIDLELSWDGGATYTTTGYGVTNLNQGSDQTYSFGGATDTWGRSWTAGELSDANFRLRLTKTGSDVSDIAVDHIQGRIEYTTPTPSLWISTDQDTSAPGADGLPDGWNEGEVLQFGGADLTLGTTTDGDFSSVIDFDNFVTAASGGVDAGALHYVSREITVGGAGGSFDLRAGDVLVSFNQDETIAAAYHSNATDTLVDNQDLLLFRPTTPGDYTDGTFHMLLDDVPDTLGATISSLHGISLVEQDVNVGGSLLTAGTFVFSEQGGVAEEDIYHFTADSVGTGTTTGTSTTLIDGSDIDIQAGMAVRGLELVERNATVGGLAMNQGSILVTLRDDDASVGRSTPIASTTHDIIMLDVTSTGVGTTAATATMVIDGSDVNLDTDPVSEKIYAIAMFNGSPQLHLPGADINYAENDAPTIIAPTATVMDPDSPDLGGGALQVQFTAGGTSNDVLSIVPGGNVTLSGSNVLVSGVTVGTFSGGNAGTPLVVNWNANSTPSAVEEVTRQIAFANSSEDPNTTTRTVEFTLSDGDGGGSAPVTSNINVLKVNDAPVVLTASSLDDPSNDVVDFQGGNDEVVLSSLPLNTAAGTDVTVEFWMNWDGANGVMPFGFERYDLWLTGGFFGFNTGSGDVYGISSAGLETGWHHVAAIFHNGTATNSRLIIDGVEQVMTQRQSTPNDSNAFVSANARISGWAADSGYKFDGQIDEVRIWNGARSEAEIKDLMHQQLAGPQAGLVASYSFAGATTGPGGVIDNSGNGHHATMVGMTAANVVTSDGFTKIGDQTVSEDDSVTLSVHAYDYEKDTLTYSWTQTSGPPVSLDDPNAERPSFTAPNRLTNYAVAFSVDVSDGTTTTTESVTINVVDTNDAPSGADQTITIDEDTDHIFIVGDFGFSDPDDGDAFTAVQISTLPASGDLYVDMDGDGVIDTGEAVSASDFINVAEITASRLKYRPIADENGAGYASFAFQVQDDGGTANGGVDLDPAPNTMTFDVNAINDAPVLSAAVSPELMGVVENASAPVGAVGTSIASLVDYTTPVGPLDNVTDVDSGSVLGIAVTAADASNGSWFYSVDGGANWLAMGSVSDSSARLLAADANTRLYMQPNAGFNAEIVNAITFRVWDQTTGVNGALADSSINGSTTAFSTTTDTASLLVNDAPILDDSGAMLLPTISEDEVTNSGDTVASVIASAGGDRITDVNSAPIEGIAIVATNNGNGAWQYSLDGGTTWLYVPGVSDSSALTLRDTDSLRFVPDARNSTAPTVTFRAWDQTTETAGTLVDASINGGTTSYSSATETIAITVTDVNDAPVLDPAENPQLDGLHQDSPAPVGAVGTLVSSLVDFESPSGQVDNVTDVDIGAQLGIAVTGADTTNGVWHYSTDNGASWFALGAISDSSARLLAADTNTRIYFHPDSNYNGHIASAITFRTWDQSSGVNGTLADASVNGATTPFSTDSDTASLLVNDAPVLDNSGSMALASITEDQVGNSGQSVASIIASAGSDRITDVNFGAIEGMAITATDNGNSSWQFSVDGGTSWSNIGTVSNSSSLLLRESDLLRFEPDAKNGTSPTLTFRAWDQATGTAGTKVNTSVNGGTTPYSVATEVASIAVTDVNDAPVLDNGGAMTLTSITEDQTSNSGDSIASVLLGAGGDRVTDVDNGAVEGIAITSYNSGNGTWQYSTDSGTSWSDIATVADSSALLLRASDRIRLVPDGESGTSADVTFRAWDQFTGAVGTKVDATVNGGVTAFSSAVETASLTVADINDDPTNAGSLPTDVVVTEDVSSNIDLSAIGVSDVDAAGSPLTVTLSTSTGGHLTAEAGTGIAIGGTASSLILTGTLTDLNVYFDDTTKLSYLHGTAHTFGDNADTITVVVNDNGNTGSGGGTDQNLGTVNVDITAVNDSPSVGSNTGATVAEGGSIALSTAMLNEADVDDSGTRLTYKVTSGPTNGQLELTTTPGVAITSFSQEDIDAGRVVFVHDGTQASSDSFDFSLADGGEDGATTATGTFHFTVGNINDAPVQSAIEGTDLAYSENDGVVAITSTLALSDVDDTNLESAVVQISANYANGEDVLSFSDENGITGSWDAVTGTLTLTGSSSVANYEAALRSISYENTSDNPSTLTRTVSFTVNDGDVDSNVESRDIAISSINDDPNNAGTLPTDITVTEDVASDVDLLAIDLSDLDDNGGSLTVTLSTSTGGNLSATTGGGVTVGGSGTSALTLTGSLADLNTFLDTASNVSYLHGTPHIFGDNTDTITVVVNDNGNTGSGGGTDQTLGTVNMDITAVNDSPVVGSITGMTISEGDTGVVITTAMLSEADVDDDGAGLTYTITDATDHGTLSLSGFGALGVGDSFTQADIDAGNVSYSHDDSETTADGFNFTLSDGGEDGSVAASDTFSISIGLVNDNAVNSIVDNDGSANQISENTTGTVGITAFADDSDLGDVVTYSLDDDDGGRFAIDANTGEVILLSGLDREIDGASRDIVVRANSSDGSTSTLVISVVVGDINESPVATGEQLTLVGATELSVSDPGVIVNDVDIDGDALSTVLVSPPGNGTLVLGAGGSLTYTPRPGFFGLDTFEYQVSDGALLSNVVSVEIEVVGAPGSGGIGGRNSSDSDSGDRDQSTSSGDALTSESSDESDSSESSTPDESDANSEESLQKSQNDGAAVSSSASGEEAGRKLVGPIRRLDGLVSVNVEAASLSALDRLSVEKAFGGSQSSTTGRDGSAEEYSPRFEQMERLLRMDMQDAIVWHYWEDTEISSESSMAVYVGAAASGVGMFSIGYVFWALRSGAMMSVLASSLPAWRFIDPAAMLTAYRSANNGPKDEVDSIVGGR